MTARSQWQSRIMTRDWGCADSVHLNRVVSPRPPWLFPELDHLQESVKRVVLIPALALTQCLRFISGRTQNKRPGKWNAWAEKQNTMRSTWIDWNEPASTKPGQARGWRGEKGSRQSSEGLICLAQWETPPELGKRSGPWLVPDSHAFHSSPSHYRQITTATSINSLIGSVKQAETCGGGTSELNSKRRPPRCLHQRTRSTLKVSIIMQVEKTIGKYQAKTIQSLRTSALGLWVCFAINLRSILAGLIMRAAVIPQDKFPQKRKP